MAFSQALCQKMQYGFGKYMSREVDPTYSRGWYGFVDALVSARNIAGVPQTVNWDNRTGKIRDFEFVRPTQNTVIVTSKQDVCLGTQDVPPLSYVIAPDVYRGTETRILEDAEFAKYCANTQDEYVNMMIAQQMDSLVSSIDVSLLGILATQFGEFFNTASNATKPVTLLKADGSLNVDGTTTLSVDYSDIQGRGNPFVIGAGILEKAMLVMKNGCCNDGGSNTRDIGGQYDFYKDQHTNTVLGANQFFILQPGAMQLVTRTDYRADRMFDNDTVIQTVFNDPITGIDFDIKIRRDECGEKWQIAVGVYYNLAVLIRPDAYVTGSGMAGTNGSLRYTGVQL